MAELEQSIAEIRYLLLLLRRQSCPVLLRYIRHTFINPIIKVEVVGTEELKSRGVQL